jgi:hypothetical protein
LFIANAGRIDVIDASIATMLLMGSPRMGLRVVLIAMCTLSVSSFTAPALAQDGSGELDLTVYGGALISSSGDDQIDALGLALGASGFVRLGTLLGLGLVLEHAQIGWTAEGPATVEHGSLFPEDDAVISHDLALLAARLYFLKVGPADLFAQLGLGIGDVTYEPEHPDCSIDEGFAAQLALGAEWRLVRSLGLHTSIAATPFGWGMGCNNIGYAGKAPDPSYAKLGLSARVGLTTVWTSP